MKRVELERHLSETRAELLALLDGRTDSDLTRDLTTSESEPGAYWSLADHLAHVSSVEAWGAQLVRSRLRGAREPDYPGTVLPAGPASMPELDSANEQYIREHRGLSPGQAVANSQRVRGEMLALVGELTDAELETEIESAFGKHSVSDFLGGLSGHDRMHIQWLREALG